MRVLLFIIKFFLIGAFFIVGNYNLALADDGNLKEFGVKYASWIESLAKNIFSVTSYVIKVEWLPQPEAYPEFDDSSYLGDR